MIFIFIALIGCSIWIYAERNRLLTFFKSLTKFDYVTLLLQTIVVSILLAIEKENVIILNSEQKESLGQFCGILPLLILIYLFNKHGLIKLKSGIYLFMNRRFFTIFLLYMFLIVLDLIFSVFIYAFLKVFGIL